VNTRLSQSPFRRFRELIKLKGKLRKVTKLKTERYKTAPILSPQYRVNYTYPQTSQRSRLVRNVRPVVAIAIDGVGTEVVLQDIVGHVDGIIQRSNLCSTNERGSIESISNLVCNSRVINHLGLHLSGKGEFYVCAIQLQCAMCSAA
jgi:hypothetical protein